MTSFYRQISKNRRLTWISIAVFVAFASLAGWMLGEGLGYGLGLLPSAFLFSSLASLGGYLWGDKLALARTRAMSADKERYPVYCSVVENIALASGIPAPRPYVINSASLNAFATGRNPKRASVAVTTGLLETLNRTELEGVVAHEVAHIRNYDTLLMVIIAVLAGTIASLATMARRRTFWRGRERKSEGDGLALASLLLAIFAPLIAQLIKLAISRQREFLADAESAKITRFPEGLASALEKIAQFNRPLETADAGTAHLFIANPLPGKLARLFSTHPPLSERIRRLREM